MSIFKKREKNELDSFLIIQEALIQIIQSDITTWQEALQFGQKKYGPNPHAVSIFNALAFYRLSYLDILLYFKYFIKANNDLEKTLFAKALSHNIYELLEDLPKIFGKEFTKALKDINSEELDAELKNIKMQLKQLKNLSHLHLKQVRHSIASHKDHDTFKQVNISQQIDLQQIESFTFAIYGLYGLIDRLEKNMRKMIKVKLFEKRMK